MTEQTLKRSDSGIFMDVVDIADIAIFQGFLLALGKLKTSDVVSN